MQNCDWEAHPAEYILGATRTGKYLVSMGETPQHPAGRSMVPGAQLALPAAPLPQVARAGLGLQEYGLASGRCLGPPCSDQMGAIPVCVMLVVPLPASPALPACPLGLQVDITAAKAARAGASSSAPPCPVTAAMLEVSGGGSFVWTAPANPAWGPHLRAALALYTWACLVSTLVPAATLHACTNPPACWAHTLPACCTHPTTPTQEYEGWQTAWARSVHGCTESSSGVTELCLEDLPEGSPLESLAFLGDCRNPGGCVDFLVCGVCLAWLASCCCCPCLRV